MARVSVIRYSEEISTEKVPSPNKVVLKLVGEIGVRCVCWLL